MSDRDDHLVLRLTGLHLTAVLLALALLVALGAWGGYRLGRGSGPPAYGDAGAAEEPDAPMEDAGREGDEGFTASVDLSSGFALIYRRTASAADARRARDELEAKGLPVRLDHDPRRPREDAFRVLVGPYPDRAAALAAADDLPGVRPGEPDLVFLE